MGKISWIIAGGALLLLFSVLTSLGTNLTILSAFGGLADPCSWRCGRDGPKEEERVAEKAAIDMVSWLASLASCNVKDWEQVKRWNTLWVHAEWWRIYSVAFLQPLKWSFFCYAIWTWAIFPPTSIWRRVCVKGGSNVYLVEFSY